MEDNNMNIDFDTLVPMAKANQNFSQVAKLVDEKGMVIILKHNKPNYFILNNQEYENYLTIRNKYYKLIIEEIISDNLEALKELAK